MKVKKGDKVRIITGADKGKVGVILRALPKEGKVIVEGVNVKKRHTKAKRQGSKGQVIDKTLPIDASNVALAKSV